MEMEAVNEFVRRIVFIGETCEDYFNWLCTHERDEENESKYEAGIVSAVMNLVMGEKWSEEVKKRRDVLLDDCKKGKEKIDEIIVKAVMEKGVFIGDEVKDEEEDEVA